MAKLSPTLVAAATLALTSACYTGVANFDTPAKDTAGIADSDPGADSGGGDAGGGGDDGAGDSAGDDHGEPFAPDPGQIRLLSAEEFTNTVQDLLGVKVEAELSYSDRASGYDNSNNAQIDENLLSILYVEAERVAEVYIAERLAADFTCYAPGPALTPACAEAIIDGLGRRAYRRPLTAAERQTLLDFTAAATASEEAADADEIVEALLVRVLMSPHFLYRTEIGAPTADDPSVAELTPFERASVISYALTGSMPDAALFAAAEADELDDETTRAHIRRLLAGPRGRAQVVRFFKQWLRVDELDAMAAHPEDYPKFGAPGVAVGLQGEFAAFVEGVVLDEDATFDELLTRELTFVNKHTAPLYGGAVEDDALQPLDLTGDGRGGVLTLASVMAVHASSSEVARDKPIRRGLLIKNQFQCEEIGLPSGIDVATAAENVLDQVDDFNALTTREQFELIMNQDDLCMTCHKQFMPFGFLWSNFDGLGQFQTHFGDRPLDAAVDELTLDDEVQSFANIMELIPVLADSPQATACFSTNVARFATGRRESSTAEALTAEFAAPLRDGELTVVELFEEILASPELYLREAPSQ
ncbi:MAG: DUF1592 domain-containing protein [Myxococcales bacterium]|nr:DUF1592 domain-containing protein [Myxococcales bacterium]